MECTANSVIFIKSIFKAAVRQTLSNCDDACLTVSRLTEVNTQLLLTEIGGYWVWRARLTQIFMEPIFKAVAMQN
jgi:hypothetical protein